MDENKKTNCATDEKTSCVMDEKTNCVMDEKTNCVTKEKLAKYFDVTGRALAKVKIGKEQKLNWKDSAEDFLDMAQRYFNDAKHFSEKGMIVTAFAALNYAHGWLDAGARLGLFDVDCDSVLFTVDEEWVNRK